MAVRSYAASVVDAKIVGHWPSKWEFLKDRALMGGVAALLAPLRPEAKLRLLGRSRVNKLGDP